MNVDLTTSPVEALKSLVIGIYEEGELTPTAKKIDKLTHGYLSNIIEKNMFQAKLGQTHFLFYPAETKIECLLLVGCGKPDTLSATGFRKIIIQAIKAIMTVKIKQFTFCLAEIEVKGRSLPWKVKQCVETVYQGVYQFDLFKTEKEPIYLKDISIHLAQNKQFDACKEALHQGIAISNGVILTKNLANTPSNICTPAFIAEQAKALAKQHEQISIHILEEKDMEKLGMGALLAVSQGSAQEAKFICLEYKNAKKSQAPIALIGKGITFDTGGNSLKSPDNMVGMKYDMCGAATVLGTFHAIAELKLSVNAVGIIAAVENMPGGTAYKPEDILTSLSGQTIEVISTDAEGRLVLADALTYCERYQPETVIDIATLTGAVVVALGTHATGMVSNYPPLANALLKAGEESHDRVWELPLWDEYQEQIKSPFADMANTGGRAAGSITAGCFLSRFAKKFHWAHLDVAGTAAMMMGTSERMATGRPVPLLVQYFLDQGK